MNDLLKSIYSKFIPGTSLYDNLGGGLSYDRSGSSLPYGVYFATTGNPDDTFGQNVDEVGIQFSFFAAEMQEVNSLVKYCRELYDDKKLSTGAVMRRVLTVPARRSDGDEAAPWQADIEFIILNEV